MNGVCHTLCHLIPDPRVSVKKGKRQTVFASATGRSPVVVAAAERYMRKEPLFVGGFDKRRGRATGLPSNIRHTFVTTTKVVNLYDVHTILDIFFISRRDMFFISPCLAFLRIQVKKFETLRRLLNTQPFLECVVIFVNDHAQVREPLFFFFFFLVNPVLCYILANLIRSAV